MRVSFAKGIELNVSEPLVSFKETVIGVTKQELMDRRAYIAKLNAQMLREQEVGPLDEDTERPVDADDFGDSDDEQREALIDRIDTVYGARFDRTEITAEVPVSGKMVTFSVEAVPLKTKLVCFVEEHQDDIQDLMHFVSRIHDDDHCSSSLVLDPLRLAKHKEFGHKLGDKLSSKMDLRDIAAFSPRSTGCNLLIVKDEALRSRCSLFGRLHGVKSPGSVKVHCPCSMFHVAC